MVRKVKFGKRQVPRASLALRLGRRLRSRIGAGVCDILGVTRKGVVAYVCIAICVSYGFHLVENRTDEALMKADEIACKRDRQMQTDADQRIDMITNLAKRLPFRSQKHRRDVLALMGALHKQSLPNCKIND